MWQLGALFGHLASIGAAVSQANAAWWTLLATAIGVMVNALIVLVAVTGPRNQAKIADLRTEVARNELMISAVHAARAAMNNFGYVANFESKFREYQTHEISTQDIETALLLRLNSYRSAES